MRSRTEVQAIFDPATCETVFGGPGRSVEVINKVDHGTARRQMRVEVNGWVISAVWGFGTYCAAARPVGSLSRYPDIPSEFSPNAEVAAWRDGPSVELIDLGGDTVAGWRSVGDVLDAITAAEHDDEAGIRQALTREAATDTQEGR